MTPRGPGRPKLDPADAGRGREIHFRVPDGLSARFDAEYTRRGLSRSEMGRWCVEMALGRSWHHGEPPEGIDAVLMYNSDSDPGVRHAVVYRSPDPYCPGQSVWAEGPHCTGFGWAPHWLWQELTEPEEEGEK